MYLSCLAKLIETRLDFGVRVRLRTEFAMLEIGDDSSWLTGVLRLLQPDPAMAACSWTVACYSNVRQKGSARLS